MREIKGIYYHHDSHDSGPVVEQHNKIDEKINAQINALKILDTLNARDDLRLPFADEIKRLATGADMEVTLDGMEFTLPVAIQHTQSIFDRANLYLPHNKLQLIPPLPVL